MNIWILTNEYPPYYGGGIATYVTTAAQMYAQAGHKVTIFIESEPVSPEPTLKNISVIRFPRISPNKQMHEIQKQLSYTPALAYNYAQRVLQELKTTKTRPDIIEAQDAMALAYYLLLNKKCGEPLLQKVPIVIHAHTPVYIIKRENHDPCYEKFAYYLGIMEKECLLLADGVMCPSQFLANELKTTLAREDIQTIPLPNPPLPHPDRKALAEVHRLFSAPITFLYIGRLEYRKGLALFLETCVTLWDQGLSFSVVALGADHFYTPYQQNLGESLNEKYATYFHKGLFKIIGKVKPTIVSAFITQASCIVVPSLYENFPFTCVEAMTLGTPVLASKQGGQAAMVGIDESCGLVFDWHKTHDLAQKMNQFLTLTTEQKQAMGLQAKKKITQLCDHKKNIQTRIAFFKNIIAQSPEQKNIFPYINQENKRLPKKAKTFKSLTVIIPAQTEHTITEIQETIDSLTRTPISGLNIIIATAQDYSVSKEVKTYKSDVTPQNNWLAKILPKINTDLFMLIPPGHQITPTYIARGVALLNTYTNIALVSTWGQIYGESKAIQSTLTAHLPTALLTSCLNEVCIGKKDIIESAYCTHALSQAQAFAATTIALLLNGYTSVCIPEILSFSRKKPLVENIFDKTFYAYLVDNHPEIIEKYALELLQLLNENKQ